MPVDNHFPAGALQNLFPTLSTATSFTAQELTATEPKGTNIIEGPSKKVVLLPHGTDAANETFILRLTLWFKCPAGSGTNSVLWYPVWIADVTCTLGSRVGVANTQVAAATLICDTLVVVAGGDSNIIFHSPTANLIGAMIVPTYDAPKLEVEVDLGTAASAGCLATSVS